MPLTRNVTEWPILFHRGKLRLLFAAKMIRKLNTSSVRLGYFTETAGELR